MANIGKHLAISLTLFWIGGAAFAQASKKKTLPAPPKLPSNYIERINLASEVPDPVDRFTYRVTGKLNGVTYYGSKVPLVDFDDPGAWKAQIGEVDVGQTITLDYIRSYAGRIWYGLPIKYKFTNGQEMTKLGWLDGVYVEIASGK